MKSTFTIPMHSDGKRITYDTQEMLQVAERFKGRDFEGTFHPKKRSLSQNAALFGLPYKIIADRLTETQGYKVTVEMVHELMKDRYKELLWEHAIDKSDIVLPDGATMRRPPSTANITTVGHNLYYKALQDFGALIDAYIPDPNEVNYSRIETNRR